MEHRTSLRAGVTTGKSDPRIAFRGRIDTLEAEVIEAQVLAATLGDLKLCACLGEVLEYLRRLMSAEVTDTLLEPPFLFGMNSDQLHEASHNSPAGVALQLPSHTQGALAARINLLRAKVREVELLAVNVFSSTSGRTQDMQERADIVIALNRLSSALWWLFCKQVS
jgi:ethanolamine utilization cobalamin adenosyltransferase